MTYKGVIKKSRTLDNLSLQALVDPLYAAFLIYDPSDLGIKASVYLAIRFLFIGVGWWLRFDTTGPVGEK